MIRPSFTNRELVLRDRIWKDKERLVQEWENEYTISVFSGETTKYNCPVAGGYRVEIHYRGWPFIELVMFDTGSDSDGYFSALAKLIEKYKKASGGRDVYNGKDGANFVEAMKDLSFKFAVQFSTSPELLIKDIVSYAFKRGAENGKCQLQESLKKLLDIE